MGRFKFRQSFLFPRRISSIWGWGHKFRGSYEVKSTVMSRTSYSTSEDGHSHSSDYEEQEETDRKMETKGSRDSAGRTGCTWTGRMRDLHRDVKRRISRLRNSRGTPPEVERDGVDPQDMIQPGSSVESIPSGSGSSLQPPTPTSSNRSSTSAGEDDTAPFVGAIVGRARALVDYTPSPYDRDGLAFKKGDIIDIIAKPKSGTWVGMVHGRVGHFKFINVEELTAETKPRHRRHRAPPDLTLFASKPETLDDLLKQLELQEYTNVLVLNGYEDLEVFKELEPEDLDSLRIMDPDHRLKLLRAAEVLLGCDDMEDVVLRHQSPRDSGCYASHENLAQKEASQRVVQNGQVSGGDAEDPDVSQSESGIQSSEGPDSNTTINNLDITTSTCAKSTAATSSADATAATSDGPEDGQEIKYNISALTDAASASEVPEHIPGDSDSVVPSGGDVLRRSAESLTRSPQTSTAPRMYGSRFTDRKQETSIPVTERVVNGSGHPFKKGKSKKSREKHSATCERGASPSRSGYDQKSPSIFGRSPDSQGHVHSWTALDRKSTTSKKKVQEYEDVDSAARLDTSPGKKHLKKAKQRKGSLQPLNRNPRPPSPLLLDAVAEKLEYERIDICQEPYTDKTGFCGIPPALVQRYAEELQRDICDVAAALDQTRIDFLQQMGRRGIPNDFLGESCQAPVVEADYSNLSSWFVSLGLPMYEEVLTSEGYSDLSDMVTVTADDLRQCGIHDQRHLRFIHTAIGALQARFDGFQLSH